MFQGYGLPNPKVKVNDKGDVDGREVIRETYPNGFEPSMMVGSKTEGKFPSKTTQENCSFSVQLKSGLKNIHLEYKS